MHFYQGIIIIFIRRWKKPDPDRKIQMSPCSHSLVLRNIISDPGTDTCDNHRATFKQFCPQEKLSSDFIKHSKVDLPKATAIQHVCHPHHSCFLVTNQTQHMHQLILASFFKSNIRQSIELLTLEEGKEILQHGMALHVNNPPEIDEPQNDSGYGSGGLQRSFVFDSRNDFDKLMKNQQELLLCCFYYGCIDSQTSKNLLRKKPTGTFLIRDSADSRYLYSLSVKTEKGATSIRILYKNGLFQFDSDERIRHKLPQFNSVLALLDFHVKVTERGGNKSWRWEEISGCKSLMVDLRTPLKNSVPSLAHLSRVKINQCLKDVEFPHLSIDKLPLDLADVKECIKQYPYRI